MSVLTSLYYDKYILFLFNMKINGTYHMMRQSFGSTGRYINKMQLISQWDVVPNKRLSLTSCTCICLSHRHFSRTQYAKLVCSILTEKWRKYATHIYTLSEDVKKYFDEEENWPTQIKIFFTKVTRLFSQNILNLFLSLKNTSINTYIGNKSNKE